MLRTAHICWRCSASLSPTLIEAEHAHIQLRVCSCAPVQLCVYARAVHVQSACRLNARRRWCCSRLVWHLYLIGAGTIREVDQPAVSGDAVRARPAGPAVCRHVVLVSLFLVNSLMGPGWSRSPPCRDGSCSPVLGGDREVRK